MDAKKIFLVTFLTKFSNQLCVKNAFFDLQLFFDGKKSLKLKYATVIQVQSNAYHKLFL